MIRFILVHGTFAKTADWPGLCASLKALADKLGEEATFDSVSWTGKNSIAARQQAGNEILDRINAILSESRGEYSAPGNNKIILIGHSHGGSAIAYFVKEWPIYADLVSGYIFLSTPFIAIRPRPNAAEIMANLLILPLGAAYFGLQQAFAPGAGMFDWVLRVSWFQLFLVLSPLLLGVLLVSLTDRSEEKVAALVHSQTADLSPINALFVRFSGDEAAAALSAVQFLSWAASKLPGLVELVLHPPFIPPRWRYYFGTGVVAPLLIILTLFMAALIKKYGVFLVFSGVVEGYRVGAIGAESLFVLSIAILASLVLIALFLIILTVFATLALTLKGFGWTGFFDGFVVELAVDPVPSGDRLFVSLDWSTRGSAAGDLVHSWGYSHPAAIDEIERFVRASVSR